MTVGINTSPLAGQSGDKVTARLLKNRLDAAASLHGVSVNTWLVQVLVRTLESRPASGGGNSRRRLTGYGRG